ncbi:MAG: CBS domain-containing protein [Acidimicrobiales bacterium]
MRVAEILRAKGTEIYTAEPSMTLEEAARLMRSHRVGSLAVLGGDGRLVGLLNERDIVSALATHGAAATRLEVATAMQRELPSCDVADTIEGVMAKMTESRARHLPVFDRMTFVGLLSIGDVVKGRLSELEQEARLVREYVTWGR